jgi:hypothetical protein
MATAVPHLETGSTITLRYTTDKSMPLTAKIDPEACDTFQVVIAICDSPALQ